MTDTPAGSNPSDRSSDPNSSADWNEVGAAFTSLGDRIQAHFAGLTGQTPPSESTQPFEDLGKQLDAALTAFRNAVSDPAISDAAKSAADQLLDALKTEVGSATDKMGEAASSLGTPDELPGTTAELPPATED